MHECFWKLHISPLHNRSPRREKSWAIDYHERCCAALLWYGLRTCSFTSVVMPVVVATSWARKSVADFQPDPVQCGGPSTGNSLFMNPIKLSGAGFFFFQAGWWLRQKPTAFGVVGKMRCDSVQTFHRNGWRLRVGKKFGIVWSRRGGTMNCPMCATGTRFQLWDKNGTPFSEYC